ncbi:4-(cytidine 5'-diphospho)-2-C-methyl-D-erythritol kinase [Pleionea sediminis]|uniref:4-(cytidine 5'-diphospho)-2-C-methyl-D-erythritol kinase n=1 Tax=Pleionea sediminis TaxID=2569479 RepID=UPI001184C33F|nr:4-(cytidine 5'-diphospho)-2-C-methyl-D-erythritol kinase [Pleionea sediminis]
MTKPVREETIILPAPAKLNLMLHITGQDERGYHLLQTMFQLLDYGDTLTFEFSNDDQVTFSCSVPELETDNNLVLQAAEVLRPYATEFRGINIHLDKVLPMGGGIGGGSSDCATTLLALNELWQCHLSIDELSKLGVSLGADIPVFIHGKTAWAEGIGEELFAHDLPELWYLVIHPECFVSTAKIFSNKALTRDCEISKIRDFLAQGGPKRGNNVMEPVVFDLYPEVKKVRDWLIQFNPDARMTGSGSCLFAPFDNEREARKIASRCEWPNFVAKGVNTSPTHTKLFGLN